jgi:hypothetical protein
MKWRQRARTTRWYVGGAALVAACLVLLFSLAGPAAVADAPQGKSADGLLVVDCLLPGQLHQLGGQVTFLTARRAIKTSASDCEIRGGEYTSYDRASYATALKIWLPLAQEGKPDAQTYVGEIFEKGLGVPPDYAAAAVWYKKAADQGFSRAAINLGGLYERGLGVPKDPTQALNWYRRAAGLNELNFQIAPEQATPAPAPAANPPPAQAQPQPQADAQGAEAARQSAEAARQSAEVARLRAEVEALRQQLSAKQDELERTQRELDRQRQDLQRHSGEADQQRGELAQLRRDLDAKRQQEGASAKDIADLESSIAEREGRLKAQDKEVAELKASLAQMEKESRAQKEDLARLRHDGEAKGPAIQLIEPEIEATRGQPMVKVPSAVEKVLLVGRVDAVAGLASLTINGREEKLDGALFRSSIPLADAEEHVRIVAIDRNGRKSTLEFLIPQRQVRSIDTGATASGTTTTGAVAVGHARPKQPIQFGTYHALVIGNNDYKFLRPLKTAADDAKEIARVLKQLYGFDVTLIVNGSRYEILSALNAAREKLTDQDNLLIYYAGHGELDQVNQRGNWLPIDAEPNSSANWISNIAITDILNAMTVRQLLVVADSCYSGTLTRSALGNIEGGVNSEERLKLVGLMAQQRSRMALTAGGIEPVLDSAGGKHSAFAQTFIDLLSTNVGLLAGQELFQLLQGRVAAAANRLDTRQIPEYAPIKFAGHESGDFFFVRAN